MGGVRIGHISQVTAPDPKNYLHPNALRTGYPQLWESGAEAGGPKVGDLLGLQSNSATSTSTNRAGGAVSEEKSQIHRHSSPTP